MECTYIFLQQVVLNNTSKDLTVEGLTVNAEHEDAQRDNYGNVYDCNVNAVYEESDAEKGDTGDTKTETRAKEEDCDVKLDL